MSIKEFVEPVPTATLPPRPVERMKRRVVRLPRRRPAGRALLLQGADLAPVAALAAPVAALAEVLRAGAVAASLAASADAGEKAKLTLELDRLRKRGTIVATLAVSFGLLAASGMAIARYI